ncbi:MAG TPA: helix-turn-helix transcriptional regulator [Conexibacter sp.]|nr:helix-turn-helix transcriptional regulator [Conexibacter sp.]
MSPDPPSSTAFGRVLRKERRARDLSQRELADMADLSFKHLGEIERGRRFPRLRTIAALERALELSPGELMRRAGEEPGG